MSSAAEARPLAGQRARWRILTALAVLAIAATTLVLASGLRRDPRDIRAASIGRPAPAFDLPRLDGSGSVRLADELAQGKAAVVYFFAS